MTTAEVIYLLSHCDLRDETQVGRLVALPTEPCCMSPALKRYTLLNKQYAY